MNFDRLRFVAERAAIGEKKEALLAVTIPERPGAFAKLIETVNPLVVTEFCYRYATESAANILIGIQVAAATRVRDVQDLMQSPKAHIPSVSSLIARRGRAMQKCNLFRMLRNIIC